MSVAAFENERWNRDDQVLSFRHREALALVEKEGIHTVLDVGCGDGLLLALVREKGIAGKGIDISSEAVKKAREKGLDTGVFDGNDIPFPDGSFDAVVLLDVLEHVYTPERLLSEAARVSNRLLILGVPNFSSIAARIQTLFGSVPENNRPHKGHIYWFNKPVLDAMLRKEGLSLRALRVNTFFEDRFLGSVFRFLAQAFPELFALSFVILAEKGSQSVSKEI